MVMAMIITCTEGAAREFALSASYPGRVTPRDILLAVFWIHSSRRTFFRTTSSHPSQVGIATLSLRQTIECCLMFLEMYYYQND